MLKEPRTCTGIVEVVRARQQHDGVADRKVVLAHAASGSQIRAHILVVDRHAIERVELVGRGWWSSKAAG